MSNQLSPENTGIYFFNDINGEYFSDSITVSHISPNIASLGNLISHEGSSGGHVTNSTDLRPAINSIIKNLCNDSLNSSSLVQGTLQNLDYQISNLEMFQ